MNKITFALLSLFIFSCNDFNKNNNLEKENELLKKELEIKNREKSSLKEENTTQKFKAEKDIQKNLIHCQNEKFIIRVDLIEDGIIRYTTWNKPNNENDQPVLILLDGEVEKQGTMGGYIYTFKNEEWTYIVEDNQMGESDESIGTFLKLLQQEELVLYTKMEDI